MTICKRMIVLMAALMGVMGLYAANALAAPAASAAVLAPQSQQTTFAPANALRMEVQDVMGYCGPPVTSKPAMIGYYMMNPTAKAHAEAYVRAHASYYHIQADQSFFAWLQMPNVKFFKAPVGYTLDGNTYCDANGKVLPYNGHYSVGGLGMLWWCQNSKGSGSGCTPITKGYCRNFVHGKKIRPVPVQKAKPKKPVVKLTPKTPTGNCNVNNSPGAIVCSNPTYVNVCGTQVIYNGDQKDITTWTNQYIADHCQPPVTTTVCSEAGALNKGSVGPCVFPTPVPPCNCTSPPPPPPVVIVTPPPPPAPPTIEVKNVTSPEEATSDGSVYRNLCADVYGKNGDSTTLVFSVVNPNNHTQSGFGSIVIQRSVTFTSNGFDRICGFAYQAPTDSTAVGQYDQLEATIHDNSNSNVKDATSFSMPFKIIASPASP